MNKLGLILEGGGMRGLYTAGVLDYFLTKQLEVDGVIGVSAGACHSTSFLSKQYERNMRVNLNYLHDKEYFSLRSFMKTGSIFGMDMLFHKIPDELDLFDYETFEKRKAELVVVSTNIETGKADYHIIQDIKKEIDYIQASASLPLLAKPVEIDGKLLMDGGCSDSIPIHYFEERGYTHNIVILTQDQSYRKGKNNLLPFIRKVYKQYPNLIEVLKRRHIDYNKTLDYLNSSSKQKKTFVIQPSQPITISRLERNEHKLKQVYELGYSDAKKAYPKLVEFLKYNNF